MEINSPLVVQDPDTYARCCTRCDTYKEIEEFHRDKHASSGRRAWCKGCESSKRRTTEPTPEAPDGHKWCPGCETVYPLDDFPVDKRRSDGRRARCRPCYKEQRADYESRPGAETRRKENRDKNRERSAERRKARTLKQKEEAQVALERGAKVCCDCAEDKPLDDFQRSNSSADGRTRRCRVCIAVKRNAPAPEDVERVERWKRKKEAFEASVEQMRAADPMLRDVYEKGEKIKSGD